jgi:hypothetical protein
MTENAGNYELMKLITKEEGLSYQLEHLKEASIVYVSKREDYSYLLQDLYSQAAQLDSSFNESIDELAKMK